MIVSQTETPYTLMRRDVFFPTLLIHHEIYTDPFTHLLAGTSETLDFQTYLTGNQVADTCAGTINSTHCYLRSAIAEYDVSVANETITLKDPGNPRFISWANNTAITNETISKFDLRVPGSPGWIKTTLGAIVNAFLFEYSFTGFAYPPGHSKHGVLDISVESQSLFMYQLINNYAQYNNQTACTYTWNDPRPVSKLMGRNGIFDCVAAVWCLIHGGPIQSHSQDTFFSFPSVFVRLTLTLRLVCL